MFKREVEPLLLELLADFDGYLGYLEVIWGRVIWGQPPGYLGTATDCSISLFAAVS